MEKKETAIIPSALYPIVGGLAAYYAPESAFLKPPCPDMLKVDVFYLHAQSEVKKCVVKYKESIPGVPNNIARIKLDNEYIIMNKLELPHPFIAEHGSSFLYPNSIEAFMERYKEEPILNLLQSPSLPFRKIDFLATEFIYSLNIHQLLFVGGAFNEAMARYLISEIIKKVLEMHRKNVVHYDIKAENILVDARGEVHIIDFGVSRDLTRNARINGGTQGWMPIEQSIKIGPKLKFSMILIN